MPRRRLSLVVAAGVLAVVALTGCRVEPGSAAFVGGTTISKADVDRVVDQFKRDGGKVDPQSGVASPSDVVQNQVFVDVAQRYAQEKGYGSPAVDAGGPARRYGVPESDPYVQLRATQDAYATLLRAHAAPVTPTDAELHDAYDVMRYQGLPLSYEETARQLRDLPEFRQGVSVMRELTDAAKRYDVQINPRYDRTVVLVLDLSFQDETIAALLMSLPADTQNPAVRDVSNNG